MPITGSFSRSAVNHASGVQTSFGGVITGKFFQLVHYSVHIFIGFGTQKSENLIWCSQNKNLKINDGS